ncbi:MAG: GNAT family N-acetyltransferase [Bacteroidetes Order II. Incertae sedis bacterium]|nr:GNAT family N-acetyltransferase [Bacteroidetes Order II. bacterium]
MTQWPQNTLQTAELKLLPFVGQIHLAILKNWITTQEELILFAGPCPFSFPLSDEAWMQFLEIGTNSRLSYLVIDTQTGDALGFAQVKTINSYTKRLCRLLIGTPANRGRGLGKQLVLALLHICFEDPETTFVDLNVYTHNVRAIRCYTQCGFKEVLDAQPNYTSTELWEAIRMVRTRKNGE